ncbi:MAG: UvrD-helicase domain-containing protein [Oscillospiraceae bacterium]|nr:UvrD-helicase domain-containing protein [Oscillospiraceae bacterium]
MKSWTDEQNRAITHPIQGAKSVLISAAAGSGKTAVLIERVIKLLTAPEHPVDADKIVLVTFTRKAAAEMKERLEKALRSCPDSPLIRRQTVRLEEAQITTINAFCLNLLRENLMFTEIDSVRVAADSELELLSKKAMTATLACFYEFGSKEVERVLAFFGAGGDSKLQRAVLDLYGFTRNIPDSDDWLSEQERLYNHPDAYYSKLVPPYYERIGKDIANAIKIIDESMESACCESTRKSLREELAFFEEVSVDYNSKASFPARRTTDRKEEDSVKALLKENRTKTKKIKDDVITAAALIAAFKGAVCDLRPVVMMLVKLERLYSEKFTEIKRACKVIDFPDSEQLCLQLLRNHKRVLSRVQNDYELMIVDEFQDSNFLQYEIFRLLDSGRGRLFLVGDIKQSIYRFRGADSAVFHEVSRNPEYEIMYLSRNFRSSDQVIDSVNDIFESVMPNYDENAKLKPGRGLNNPDYQTELRLLNEDDFPGLDGITAEATYTAFRINQMMSEGFKVFGRRCGWGDFAVLSSTGEKNFRIYEKVFRENGIPCVSAGGGGYLKTEEIGLALDLLMVINNPYNDLSLFNMMMSPLYRFTAEEIAVCRIGKKSIPLYSAVLQSRNQNNPKISAFLSAIARYRRIADISSVSELIAVINAEGGFLPLHTDAHKKANIRLLTYYADTFAATETDSSLPAFLAYIKDLKEVNADIKQANINSRSSDCVRLMTIHGAKGLEFPVCFVARVNQEFNFRGDKNPALVKFDKVAGITAECFDSVSLCRFRTLHAEYGSRLNRELTVREEMHKLYVAATRAECKLIFTGYVKNEKIKENSYLQLIVNSNSENLTVKKDKVSINDKQLIVNREESALNEDEAASNMSAVYPRTVLGTIPRKVTATQVGVERSGKVSFEYDEPSIFPRNPSFYGLRRLTGKKRGDAYHKMMELIDFFKGDYTAQFKSLEHRFTPIEYHAVNPLDIVGFFESVLGRRAVKSAKVVKEYKLYTETELADIGVNLSESDAVFSEKPFVQGIADMFFYENGEIVLVDYKTNRNSSPERLKHEYKGQLAVYKRAIEEMTGVRVKECWLYSFELGEILI